MSGGNCTLNVPAKNSYRMVVLGASRVGKSSIVSRFLNGRFEDQYTPTIEDFHRKVYNIRGDMYQLDILDTSGNHPFPAMRRLSILTGEKVGESLQTGNGGWKTIMTDIGLKTVAWDDCISGIRCIWEVGKGTAWFFCKMHFSRHAFPGRDAPGTIGSALATEEKSTGWRSEIEISPSLIPSYVLLLLHIFYCSHKWMAE